LHRRAGSVLLVQRAHDESLMPGMWELPEAPEARISSSTLRKGTLLFALRHAITVTDYTVKVWRGDASGHVGGKWIATGRLSRLALTGLARKILRKATIL
jgi:hypothetical protein